MSEIDKGSVREYLKNQTTIERCNPVPEQLRQQASIIIGNYIGMEPELMGNSSGAFLTPTMDALIYLTYAISPAEGKNRLLAVARSQVLDTLPEHLSLIKSAVIAAEKKGDDYKLGIAQQIRMMRHIGNDGVIWMAPAATTTKDGLLLDIRTGSIRLAREKKANLGILALETSGIGLERKVTQLHVEHIPLPTVLLPKDIKVNEKEIQRSINLMIGRYALARTASLLPKEQDHGDYRDAQAEMEIVKYALHGMSKKGIMVMGGFLD